MTRKVIIIWIIVTSSHFLSFLPHHLLSSMWHKLMEVFVSSMEFAASSFQRFQSTIFSMVFIDVNPRKLLMTIITTRHPFFLFLLFISNYCSSSLMNTITHHPFFSFQQHHKSIIFYDLNDSEFFLLSSGYDWWPCNTGMSQRTEWELQLMVLMDQRRFHSLSLFLARFFGSFHLVLIQEYYSGDCLSNPPFHFHLSHISWPDTCHGQLQFGARLMVMRHGDHFLIRWRSRREVLLIRPVHEFAVLAHTRWSPFKFYVKVIEWSDF